MFLRYDIIEPSFCLFQLFFLLTLLLNTSTWFNFVNRTARLSSAVDHAHARIFFEYAHWMPSLFRSSLLSSTNVQNVFHRIWRNFRESFRIGAINVRSRAFSAKKCSRITSFAARRGYFRSRNRYKSSVKRPYRSHSKTCFGRR